MTTNNTERTPSPKECHELMARYAMLPNIVDHSIQVMRVALAITDHLQGAVPINRDLVIAGALLHDITKTRSLETKERHDTSGGKLLRELGFPCVADIVEQHVILQDFHHPGRVKEREIVYYADKRVMHDTIVTVEERMNDLIDRYGSTDEIRTRIRQNMLQVLVVEGKIAGFMEMDIHDAIRQITDR